MCDLPTSQYGDNLRQMLAKKTLNRPNCYRRIQNAWKEAYDADPEPTTT